MPAAVDQSPPHRGRADPHVRQQRRSASTCRPSG